MKHNYGSIYYSCVLMSVVFFPGCIHIIDWGKETLRQGDVFWIDMKSAQSYIKSVSAYNEFTLIANFDVLWLTLPVRSMYVNGLVKQLGKSEQQKEILLTRQKEELKHFIMFYVAVPYDISLGESQSNWVPVLAVDQAYYNPIEIKVIELHPLYMSLFSNRIMRFCNIYQLKFDAQLVDGSPIITSNIGHITLLFRSLDRELQVSWDIKE